MKSMRRLMLAVLLSLSYLACGGDEGAPDKSPGSEPKEEEEEEEKLPERGTLAVLLHGLPKEVQAMVSVVGPDGAELVLAAGTLLEGLEVGTYRVEASARTADTMRYTPEPSSTEVEVEKDETTTVEIVYTATERELFEVHAKTVVVPHFGRANLVVDVERPDDWEGSLMVRAEDLPAGYSANEVMVGETSTVALLHIDSDGSARSLLPFTIRIVGEGGGKTKETEVTIRPALLVFEKEEGVPGSLQSLVEALAEIDEPEVPTIGFDEGVFGEPSALVFSSTLLIRDDVVIQGIWDGQAPRIFIEGNGEEFTLLKVSGSTVEIREMGFRNGKAPFGALMENAGTLTLRKTHLIAGQATGAGGGIHSQGELHVEDSVIEGCTADTGGGIYNYSQKPMTIHRTQFLGNEAHFDGGGIFAQADKLEVTESRFFANKATRQGGGLFLSGSSFVISSLIEENEAVSVGGGGIYSLGGLFLLSSTLRGNKSESAGGGMISGGKDYVANSTFAENWADGLGGALMVKHSADATVIHTTIADNKSKSVGGLFSQEATLTLLATIIYGNWAEGMNSDIIFDGGTYVSHGYNMFGEDDDTLPLIHETDSFQVDPNLESLADNGGPTPTMALRSWSAAIDTIPICAAFLLPDSFENFLEFDQRGFPRPAGEGCDPGAFELQ